MFSLSSFCKMFLCVLWFVICNNVNATTYYINSRVGDDNNSGITKDAVWKSLKNLEKNIFKPGDSILFAKGSEYKGGFTFTNSGTMEKPIVFSSYSVDADVILKTDRAKLQPIFIQYGAGRDPSFSNPDWNVINGNVFHIKGSYIIIDGLYFHDNTKPPNSDHKNKNVQKMGAIYLALGTHHNIVRNCEFYNSPVGVKIKGKHNLITRNYFHDAYDSMAHSWGPIAIMIVTPYNEISWNKIMNYGSYAGPYGSDGGVVELDGVDDAFDGRNVNIHHNTSTNNHGFLELAGRKVDSITVAYNLSDDRNQFIGGGSMKNILVFNNTVIRTREPNVDRYIFWTFNRDSTFLTVKNNIFVLASDIKVFGTYIKPVGHKRTRIGEQVHDHNLYFSPGNDDPIGIAAGKGDKVADPLFIDFKNKNFRLRKNSPAINAGVRTGYTEDL
ncbi:MAG: hypothetical protein ACR2KX_16915, partial [Chitinophagaceae bacterium]